MPYKSLCSTQSFGLISKIQILSKSVSSSCFLPRSEEKATSGATTSDEAGFQLKDSGFVHDAHCLLVFILKVQASAPGLCDKRFMIITMRMVSMMMVLMRMVSMMIILMKIVSMMIVLMMILMMNGNLSMKKDWRRDRSCSVRAVS